MLALLFGIIIICFAAIMDFFYRRELKDVRETYAAEIRDLVDDNNKIKTMLENDIAELELMVQEFEAQKDPDSMFPSMESSTSELIVKSKLEALQGVYRELFPQ
jgi:vacuolar-type H+-ATPase subunit D/Vma8